MFTHGVQRAGSRSWYSTTSNVDALSKDFCLEFFLRTSERSRGGYDDHVHAVLNTPAAVKFYTGLDAVDGDKDEILRLARLHSPILSEKTSQGRWPVVTTDIPVEAKVARLSVDMMGPDMLQAPDDMLSLTEHGLKFAGGVAGTTDGRGGDLRVVTAAVARPGSCAVLEAGRSRCARMAAAPPGNPAGNPACPHRSPS